jgi:glycosyltransferase involved in cell wall biosynthesis
MSNLIPITVLMPVYNAEKYLAEAIESILNQSFSDFEFLIVDDASTDKSVDIINSYDDERIKLIHNDKNFGVTYSLNRGLKLAFGKYIARQDADDISFKNRLQLQYEYLENHPQTVLLGSQAVFDKNSLPLPKPTERAEVYYHLLAEGCAFYHGSVMFKLNAALEAGGYCEKILSAQDYDLWLRLGEAGEVENLEETCYFWREHETQISVKKADQQRQNALYGRQMAWQRILDGIDESDRKYLQVSYNVFAFKRFFYILASSYFSEKEHFDVLLKRWHDFIEKISILELRIDNDLRRFLIFLQKEHGSDAETFMEKVCADFDNDNVKNIVELALAVWFPSLYNMLSLSKLKNEKVQLISSDNLSDLWKICFPEIYATVECPDKLLLCGEGDIKKNINKLKQQFSDCQDIVFYPYDGKTLQLSLNEFENFLEGKSQLADDWQEKLKVEYFIKLSHILNDDADVNIFKRRIFSSRENSLVEAFIEQFFVNLAHKYKKIALFGAGFHSKWLLDISAEAREIVTLILDENSEESFLKGIPVDQPANLKNYDVEAVVISTDNFHYELFDKLRNQQEFENIDLIDPYRYLPQAPFEK